MTQITITYNHGKIDLHTDVDDLSDFQSLLYTIFASDGQLLLKEMILQSDELSQEEKDVIKILFALIDQQEMKDTNKGISFNNTPVIKPSQFR
ncbi:MAG: hypothetical protein NWE83_07430 [Candidatus Bathyarchaeota archaeon]|nr:hypothetical protein [Candidatus Bathyarchaeota archaeon]